MDPTHPTITIDPGVSVEAYAWVSAAAVRDGEEKLVEKEHIYELDTTKYGLTQSTFLNYYKKIIVKNPYGRTHSDWDSLHKEYRNDFTFDITKAGEYMFYEWSGTGGWMFASAKGRVKWEWNGNTLKIKFWATVLDIIHSGDMMLILVQLLLLIKWMLFLMLKVKVQLIVVLKML
ncbi:hypothetical protein M1770_02760 [Spiroplasma citri]|nr:hypothetical protein [Spiroplasma citri]WFG98906.1 hypothetical protein M1770_02760 [Spiroplasma citri]